MRISEAWAACEADRRLDGYSRHTLKGYGIQARLFIRFLGDRLINEITTADLKRYLAAQTHLKPSSLGHRTRFLKSFFRWVQDEGYIVGNPTTKVKEPKEGKRIPKALSEEDTEMLREGCITPREHALVEFIYTSGCRIGEVASLNRNTIDWEARAVVVHGKGDKEREVYFTVKTAIWLKKYLKGRKDTNTALFVTERKYNG